ncbi:hypothetical protein CLU96_2537 [Chryseobacterium sp. 52]|nr:hypothetical protein CLU96_2537 [Chryseobacterium sp. 52]
MGWSVMSTGKKRGCPKGTASFLSLGVTLYFGKIITV